MSYIPPFMPLTPIIPLVPSLTEEDLQLSMPDFADLLRMEPATPSPLKHLRADSPSIPSFVSMPSNQLFSKYLASPDNRDKDPSAYSPSDKPFLHPDPELPVPVSLRSPSYVSSSSLVPIYKPVPLLSPVSSPVVADVLVSSPVVPVSSSVVADVLVSSPVVPVVPVSSPVVPDVLVSSPVVPVVPGSSPLVPVVPVSSTGPDSPTVNTIPVQDVPWDLSSTTTYRDPWEIDCRVPTNIGKPFL